MTTMKETIAAMILKGVIEPFAGKELKNSCFNVEVKNNHGEIDVKLRGCE